MAKEVTYVMVKPDGVKKKLTRVICDILVSNDLMIHDILPEVNLTPEIIKEHYSHLIDKPFYPELEQFMLSGPVVPMIVYGEDAVSKVRAIIGPTNVKKAKEESPESIRAIYGDLENASANIVHASDSPENALIEIKRFFGKDMEQPSDCKVKCLFKSTIL